MVRTNRKTATTNGKDASTMEQQQHDTTVAVENGNGASIGHNQPPTLADEWFARLDSATLAQCASGVAEIDALQRGDEQGQAWTIAASLAPLHLSIGELLEWYPGSKANAMEDYLRVIHHAVAPNSSHATLETMSNALWLAVSASSKAKADEAKIGNGTEKKPQFPFVRTYVAPVPASVPEDKRPKGAFVGDATGARKELESLRDAATGDEKQMYADAIDAIDNVAKLRRFGNALSASGMARTRHRRIHYAGVCQSYLTDFANRNPAVKIGKVWPTALSKAAEAHKAFMNDLAKRSADDRNAEAEATELAAKIKDAVWDRFLADKVELTGKPVKSEDEIRSEMVARLWTAIHKVDSEFSVVIKSVVDTYLNKVQAIDPDTANMLRDPQDKADAAAEAERAERERAAKLKQQQELEEQQKREAEATAERQRQREEKKAAAAEAKNTPTAKPATATKPAAKLGDRITSLKRGK